MNATSLITRANYGSPTELLYTHLSSRFDATRAHASALVHFAQVQTLLVVNGPVDLVAVVISNKQKNVNIRERKTTENSTNILQ